MANTAHQPTNYWKIKHMKSMTSTYKTPSAPKHGGFTLIELMITVAIVGILASIAYPSYMSQMRKTRRSDAVQSLAAIQQAQERYRSNNPTYAANLTTLTINSASSGGYYTLAVPKSGASAPTGTSYTASAVAVSSKSQAGDTGCSTMSITVTNGSAINDQPSCWSQ